MAEEQKEPLQSGEENLAEEEGASEKNTDIVSEDVQNTSEEETDKAVEELLGDGTTTKKEVRIPYDKFEKLNEKSKLYDSFSPLLVKLNQKPDLVDKLLESDKGETLEQRLSNLEEERKTQKRAEIKQVIGSAIKTWPDFKDKYNEIKPIVFALEKQGMSYEEAIQRAYFAVNPEAAQKNLRLVTEGQTKEAYRSVGKISSSVGASKVIHQPLDDFELSDSDREFAQKTNISPELYKKHWKYLEEKGLTNL